MLPLLRLMYILAISWLVCGAIAYIVILIITEFWPEDFPDLALRTWYDFIEAIPVCILMGPGMIAFIIVACIERRNSK